MHEITCAASQLCIARQLVRTSALGAQRPRLVKSTPGHFQLSPSAIAVFFALGRANPLQTIPSHPLYTTTTLLTTSITLTHAYKMVLLGGPLGISCVAPPSPVCRRSGGCLLEGGIRGRHGGFIKSGAEQIGDIMGRPLSSTLDTHYRTILADTPAASHPSSRPTRPVSTRPCARSQMRTRARWGTGRSACGTMT